MINQAKKKFSRIDDCWVSRGCPKVDVWSLIVLGNPANLLELSNSVLVGQIDAEPLESTNRTYSPTPTPNATPAPYNLWVPSRGSIHIHPSVVQGERYVRNRMRWDTASRLSAFGLTSTYEHDFFLNDSDGSVYGPGTYLSDAQDIFDVPIVSHWSSNLPSPYLDTRFGDPDYVKAFTIGSADADSIQPVTFYYYYIRTPNGDANNDNGYLLAQIGHRVPSGCYTTWCAFGVQDPEAIYLPYDGDPIPGDFTWVFTKVFLPLAVRDGNNQLLAYPPPPSSESSPPPDSSPYPPPPYP